MLTENEYEVEEPATGPIVDDFGRTHCAALWDNLLGEFLVNNRMTNTNVDVRRQRILRALRDTLSQPAKRRTIADALDLEKHIVRHDIEALRDDGLVESYWQEDDHGRQALYYILTEKGEERARAADMPGRLENAEAQITTLKEKIESVEEVDERLTTVEEEHIELYEFLHEDLQEYLKKLRDELRGIESRVNDIETGLEETDFPRNRLEEQRGE